MTSYVLQVLSRKKKDFFGFLKLCKAQATATLSHDLILPANIWVECSFSFLSWFISSKSTGDLEGEKNASPVVSLFLF